MQEEQGQERSEASRSSWRAFLRMTEAKRGFSNSIKVREFVSDKGGSAEHEVCIPGAQPSTSQTSPSNASLQNLAGRLSKTYAFALQSSEHSATVLRHPSSIPKAKSREKKKSSVGRKVLGNVMTLGGIRCKSVKL